MNYEIKITRESFHAIRSGQKKFEVVSKDRDYKVGDVVVFDETDNMGNATGNRISVTLSYVADNQVPGGQAPGTSNSDNFSSREQVVLGFDSSYRVPNGQPNPYQQQSYQQQSYQQQSSQYGGEYQQTNGQYQRPGGQYQQTNGQYQRPGGEYQQTNGQYQRHGGQYQQSDGQYQPSGEPYYPRPDSRSFGFAVLSFFFPIVGLVLWIVWRTEKPQKAKSCGIGAIVGAAASVAVYIIYFVLMVVSGVVLSAGWMFL